MTAWLITRAAGLVRHWTRFYTRRLPAPVRDARRAEIESDLWEFLRDRRAPPLHKALQMIGRLLLGIPDDLTWRAAQQRTHHSSRLRRVAVAAVVAAVLIAGGWLFNLMLPAKLPLPPNMMKFDAAPPPPSAAPRSSSLGSALWRNSPPSVSLEGRIAPDSVSYRVRVTRSEVP